MEVVCDLVPEVNKVGAAIYTVRLAKKCHCHNVLCPLPREVLFVEHEVVRYHSVIVDVHDVLAMLGQAVTARPQCARLVSLRREGIYHVRVYSLDHLEGVVFRPVEIPIVANNNISGGDVLYDLSNNRPNFICTFMAWNNDSNFR